ncbi:MAG: hypothetical protein IJW65_02785 [Clostridia bacterium]|nr:hypothetical protein [Clostridia bacterium]
MDEKRNDSKLNRIAECLKNRDYSNPELTGAKIISLSLLVILLLGLFVLVTRIDSIQIKGDLTVFSETEIVEASGLRVGGCLYSKPFFVIKSELRKNLPMAEKISVHKNFFTRKVTIKVEFSDFEYYIQSGDRFFGVDSNLRVTDIRESRLDFASLGARTLTLPQFEAPVLGESIVFSATLDVLDEDGYIIEEGEPISKFEYITRLLGFLKDGGYLERVDAVFLDEKFNIRIVLDGRYLVYIGKCDSLRTKFEVIDAIISEGSTDYGKYVVINVQNPALASARVDNELDLERYAIYGKHTEEGTEKPTEAPTEVPTEAGSQGDN